MLTTKGDRTRLDAAYQGLLSQVMDMPHMYERDFKGCRAVGYYMIEMELEERNPDWARDMELALRSLWLAADHDQFDMASRCHASICRIVVYPEDGYDREALRSLQQHVSLAFFRSELTRAVDWLGGHGNGEIIALMFRSKRRDWADEARCGNISDNPSEITAQRDFEAIELTQGCSGSNDRLYCLSQHGFRCTLIVNYGDTPYRCRKAAQGGYFEALWTPEDDGYTGKVYWINDYDNE